MSPVGTASLAADPILQTVRSLQARSDTRTQMAAAARLLEIDPSGPNASAKLIAAAGRAIQQQSDALAAMATGLGGSFDAYA